MTEQQARVISPQRGAQTREEREEILRAIFERLKTKQDKLSSMIFGDVPDEVKDLVPRLKGGFSAMDMARMNNFAEQEVAKTRTSARVEEQEHREFRTLRVAKVEELGLETPKTGPALLEIQRDTGRVEIRDPAPINQFVPEEKVAGHRNFYADLVTTVRYDGGLVVPMATQADFDRAAPCPLFKYAGIERFCKGSSDLLKAKETKTMSSADKARHLAQVLEEMPIERFLKLQALFYVLVTELVTDAEGYVIMESSPLSLTFSIPEMAKKFRKLEMDRQEAVHRATQVTIKAPVPRDDEHAVRQLVDARTYRGEGSERLSLFTEDWNVGGKPPKVQVQVTLALSLILPLVKEDKDRLIYIRPASKNQVTYLEHALKERQIQHIFHVSSKEAVALRQQVSDQLQTCETVPLDATYIDLFAADIPTVRKGQSLPEAWAKTHKEVTPKTKVWIARRKILPSIMEQFSTYFYQSIHSHAYDVIESNMPDLVRAKGVVVYNPSGKPQLSVKEEYYPAKKLTPDKLFELQWIENRKKTSILQGKWAYKVDETLNLWEPPVVFTKKDMRATKVEVEEMMGTQATKRRKNEVLVSPVPQRPESPALIETITRTESPVPTLMGTIGPSLSVSSLRSSRSPTPVMPSTPEPRRRQRLIAEEESTEEELASAKEESQSDTGQEEILREIPEHEHDD